MKDALKKNLDLFLNIQERTQIAAEDGQTALVIRKTPEEEDVDFEAARENIKSLLERGDEALDGILDLARTSEHPRTYEVAGQLIKTLVEANRDLLNLHKQVKDLKPREAPVTQNIEQAVFVGSTTELLELRKKQKEANG